MEVDKYPFVRKLIADAEGNIQQVVIDFNDYQHLLEVIEDEALILAMKEVQGETPRSISEALAELKKE
ncbi:MAG: hypothetical protein KME17_07615 [Cyanosarcina radialis HA8281-LM2]|jgi:hypothetical protein|nr:hypothetical protein [Cyanosarcina radialis HA8281-LM2]